MEHSEIKTEHHDKQTKKPILKRGAVLKKVDLETAKLIFQFKEKANRKNFGRKIKDGEIISMAVRLLGPDNIQELQEATFSEQDRLHISHENFMKQNGKISLDQFIGKLIRGEISATSCGNFQTGSKKD